MTVRNASFLQFGLPFLTFMVGGTYALSYVIDGRYQLRDEVQRQKKLLLATDSVTLPPRTAELSAADAAAAAAAAERDYEIKRVPRESGSH